MTPAARAQMAIEILDALGHTAQPTDRFLKDWFRSRRFAGSKDRRAIAEQVFGVQRHRASLVHRMGADTPRALVIAALAQAGDDVTALFTGGGYGPAPLDDTERAALATTPAPAPAHVTGEYPQWLEDELTRAFGDRVADEMAAFIPRAPTDLRVNTLKVSRNGALDELRVMGITAAPTPHAPHGLRIAGDAGKLSDSDLFRSGGFEMQDEAAQIAADLAGAAPGMRVLDLAAGAGGKSLAFAAAMKNQGEIIACDVRPEALAELDKRASRAYAVIIKTIDLNQGQPDGLYDRIFVDAPCSGTGTWRRQPELRWRLTPARLAELTALQDRLLDQAAGLLAPAGQLFYATCSILPVENQDRVAAFQARNPGFVPFDLSADRAPVPGLSRDFRASPATTGTDGFFCAGLHHQ